MNNNAYACEYCGNTTIPDDAHGFCGVCHRDDFLPIEAWELGSQFFRDLVALASDSDWTYPRQHHDGMSWWLFPKDGRRTPGPIEPYWEVHQDGRVYHKKEGYLAYSPNEVNDFDQIPKGEEYRRPSVMNGVN
jgi:hypothetical protein